MANVSDIRGAVIVGSLWGNAEDLRISTYYCPSSDGTILCVGDIVKLLTATDASGYYQQVIQATATDVPVGIVVGVDPILGVNSANLNLQINYRPASTGLYLRVCDDPRVLFWLQASAATTVVTNGSKNTKPSVASGSTTTGLAATTLDQGQIGTTNTLMLKMHGLLNRPDNVAGTFEKILCSFNVHAYTTETGVAGI